MADPIPTASLPGSDRARRFEGRDHGGVPVSLFVSHNPPGTGAKPHRHPYPETFVIERGSVTFTIDGEEVHAVAGQILVVPAGAVHGFVSTSDDHAQVSIHPSDHVVQELVEE
jgi:quercetin dioxygenase-like cupin family protein